MANREDLNVVGVHAVDNAMAMINELTNCGLMPFGHNPTLLRKIGERRQAPLESIQPFDRPSRPVLPDVVDNLAGPL